MNINHFIKKTEFGTLKELEKVELLLFYHSKKKNLQFVSLNEIAAILFDLGFPKPNLSRLKKNMKESSSFLFESNSKVKLSFECINKLEGKMPELSIVSEEIFTENSILPESLYSDTRGYIEKICKQINASYENNISDGCAVLMRRLIEILLILGYKNLNRENEILDDGQFKSLNFIINYTKTHKVFSLSKDATDCIDDFRIIGNFSAHKIQYNCRKDEIKKVARDFRATVEELLYASGLK